MNSYQIKKTVRCVASILGLSLFLFQPLNLIADDRGNNFYEDGYEQSHNNNQKVKRIRGITVTGVNSVKGRPLFDWGEPFGTFNFPAIFAYNENGGEPLEIDENTPDSAIMATGVSPLYLLTRGETPDVVDPAWVNVPLRDVPINIDFDYVEEIPLPGLDEAQPLELSQAEPVDDITLGQWMAASGVAKIDCSGEGANVKLKLKKLIPNRIYSVWATVNLPDDIEGEPGRYSSTLPIGGTPNIFMTDSKGNATYERWIKFCPFETEATDSSSPSIPVLNMEILYHADHEAYGAIPAPGIMLGLIVFSHIVFPIDVVMLEQ